MVAFGAVFTNQLADAVAVALIVLGSGMFFIGMLLPTLTEFQIGLKGFSAKLRDRDEEIKASLEPESDSLLQVAIRLTGDRRAGQELLERALIEIYMRWSKAKGIGAAELVRDQLADLVPSAPAADSKAGEPQI